VSQADSGARIPDDAVLWRRVPPVHVVADGPRPSSAAFDPHPDDGGTSSCVANVAGTPDAMMEGHETYWLVELTAGEARRVGFEVHLDTGAVPYPGHGNLTWSASSSARKRAQKRLANSCSGRWRIRRA
jgi:hypothetical protein